MPIPEQALSPANPDFFPMSRFAANRAFTKVFDLPAPTNHEKYARYRQQMFFRQPRFEWGIGILAVSKEMLYSRSRLQRSAYFGGAIVCMAAAEEQARKNRVAVPQLIKASFDAALNAQFARGGGSKDDLANLRAMYKREVPPEVLAQRPNEPFEEYRRRLGEFEVSVTSYSPQAVDNTQLLQNIATFYRRGAEAYMEDFRNTEGEFYRFMSQEWWTGVDESLAFSHLAGATDMHLAIRCTPKVS